jgi:hypothetical protein
MFKLIFGAGTALSAQQRTMGWTPRFDSRRGQGFLSTLLFPDRLLGPPSLLSNGYRVFAPGVKGRRREAGHSTPSNTEVNNGGAIPPLPHTSAWRGS